MEHQESISWNKGSATVKTYKIFSFQFGKAQLIYYQCSSILNQSDVGIIKILIWEGVKNTQRGGGPSNLRPKAAKP